MEGLPTFASLSKHKNYQLANKQMNINYVLAVRGRTFPYDKLLTICDKLAAEGLKL